MLGYSETTIVGTIILVGVLIAYLLPGVIASSRRLPCSGKIWLISLALGWTVLGWVAAFWMAATRDGSGTYRAHPQGR